MMDYDYEEESDDGKPWCNGSVYICSSYFVLTTFTANGEGDIMPKNVSEVIYTSILMIVSTMLYLVYIGEFSNIIQYQSFRSFSFYCKYLELQEFLKNNRVSKNLVHLLNNYSKHLWREARGEQLPFFLKSAPHCLKQRVMSAAYLEHFTSNALFMNCEAAFLRQLVTCLQLYIYDEDKFVVKEGEVTDTMYIVHTGRILEKSENLGLVRMYQTGEYFGVVQGLGRDLPFTSSYWTIQKSQILSLTIDDWDKLLLQFPESHDAIYKHLKDMDPDVENRSQDTSLFKQGNPRSSKSPSATISFAKSKSALKPKKDISYLFRQTSDRNLPGIAQKSSTNNTANWIHMESLQKQRSFRAVKLPTTATTSTPAVESLASATRDGGSSPATPADTGTTMATILKSAWKFLGGVIAPSEHPLEEVREVKIEDLNMQANDLLKPRDETAAMFRDESMSAIELSHILSHPELLRPLHRDFNIHRPGEAESSKRKDEPSDYKSEKLTEEAKDETSDKERHEIRDELVIIKEKSEDELPVDNLSSTVIASSTKISSSSSKPTKRVTYKDMHKDSTKKSVDITLTESEITDSRPDKTALITPSGHTSDNKDSNDEDKKDSKEVDKKESEITDSRSDKTALTTPSDHYSDNKDSNDEDKKDSKEVDKKESEITDSRPDKTALITPSGHYTDNKDSNDEDKKDAKEVDKKEDDKDKKKGDEYNDTPSTSK